MPDLENSIARFDNTGREADSLGGSVSLTYWIRNHLRLSGNYTFRHSWYISDPDEELGDTGGRKGERVAWEPAHLANLSFHYIPKDGLRLGMTAHAASSRDMRVPGGGDFFGQDILTHTPAFCFIGSFIAWRTTLDSGWIELGVRAYNLLDAGFRDRALIIRGDGVPVGGELIGRRIVLFLRGTI